MSSSTPLLPQSSARRLPPALPNRSFIYPLYGIPYLITHPRLHPPLLSRILPLSLLSFLVVTLLFTFLYIPHVLFLSLLHGPLVWTNAALMILSESAGIVAILAEALFTEKQIVDVFDTVLLEKSQFDGGRKEKAEGMVRAARVLDEDVVGEWHLGKHRIDPYIKWGESIKITCWFLLELPLNLIPLVGPPLFLCLQGYHLGPLAHYRYFQLLGIDKKSKAAFIKRNRFRYFLFGLVHVLLQLVPVASIFFLFTTGTGAAIWAVDNEKRIWEDEGRPNRYPAPPTRQSSGPPPQLSNTPNILPAEQGKKKNWWGGKRK